MTASRRLIVGISGASGIAYGIRALEILRGVGIDGGSGGAIAASFNRRSTTRGRGCA